MTQLKRSIMASLRSSNEAASARYLLPATCSHHVEMLLANDLFELSAKR